jgi:hypothetical protein
MLWMLQKEGWVGAYWLAEYDDYIYLELREEYLRKKKGIVVLVLLLQRSTICTCFSFFSFLSVLILLEKQN